VTHDPDIDVTEADLPSPGPPAGAQSMAELSLRPTREVLTPIDPDDVVASMQAYQALLPRLLHPSDFQDAGGGKKFVKRSGWRKIARAFNLSLVLVDRRVDRDESGNPIRAEAIVRAIAPNGQCQDGDGYCSIDERRFKDARGRQRIEQDLRATAMTRAKSRAIADLVGMGDISADELEETPFGPESSPGLRDVARQALAYLLDGDLDATDRALERLADQFDGRFPVAGGQAVVLVANAVRDRRESLAAEAP
jgi:hypothetical protein